MEISVFSIQKSSRDNFENEIQEYIKMSAKFAKINDKIMFNEKIAKAQSSGRSDALRAYDEIYEPNLKGFCVMLDENGLQLDSQEFAQILNSNSQINFFIGGAYGLSQNLKNKAQKVFSKSYLKSENYKSKKIFMTHQLK